MNTPVWLLTGPLGCGKTTLLRHLLSQKPAGQHWGVLINDLSAVGIDAALLEDGRTRIHNLPGGCICCSVQQDFRQALDALVSEGLDALWIEPSGMGDPVALVSLLRQHPRLELRGVIAVLDAGEHSPEELRRWQSLMNMITIADGIVVNKTDRVDAGTLSRLTRWLQGLWPPKQWVHATTHGRLPPSLVHALQPYEGLRLLQPVVHATAQPADWPHAPVELPGLIRRAAQRGDHLTLSWQWQAGTRFDWRGLDALFHQLGQPPFEGVIRAKGVFRTGEDSWMALQWSAGGADRDLSGWRRDSRLMLVRSPDAAFDSHTFERHLRDNIPP